MRDSEGKVLVHSRRAFGTSKDDQEAKLVCFLWGLESMKSLRFNKVIFAVQDPTLVGVVNRHMAWPSFSFHSQEIKRIMGAGLEWKVIVEVSAANRGANFISQSVTRDIRLNSYVAVGYPSWLKGVFEEERVLPSL